MTEESIGTARLDIVVGTEQFDTAIERAKTRVSGMSAAAQAEYAKLNAAEKRRVDSLINQADKIGLVKEAQVVYNAQLRAGGTLAAEIAKRAANNLETQAKAQRDLAAAQERSSALAAEAERRSVAIRAEAVSRIQAETAAREKNWQVIRAQFADEQRLVQMRADAMAAFAAQVESQQQRAASVQATAASRTQAETAAREKNWQIVRAQFADEQRLAKMREDAAHAFGPGLAAQELANAGALREAGVRDRLSKLLATERGQRILSAQAVATEAGALAKGAAALGGTGKSAKELQFALRGLPAQITDIVTGLASGQRPLTILFQQGGQLKDMFGGIVPAARALGGAVLGLVNPFTVAAAAIGLTALAMKDAADQADGLNRAIILTGNFAKTSSDQLRQMADRVADATSATKGAATDVVTQVAATGRFTADQIEAVATAAIKMQKTAGVAIEETVRQFVSLADDPVHAIEQLDKASHAFSATAKNQAKSLVEQGHAADAASQAIIEYANKLNSRADQVNRNLSGWALLWHDVGTAGAHALDGLKRGLAETDAGTKAAISSTNGLLTAFSANLGVVGTLYQRIFNIRSQLGQKASFGNVTGTADTVAADFAQHRGLPADFGLNVPPPEAKKKTGGGASGIESAASRNALQAFEDQLKKEQAAIANETQILEANYAARNIAATEYYAEQKRLAQENTDVQVKALEGEIAALQSRNVKGKTSIENATEIAQKEAELAKVRADGATKLEVLNIQEAAQLKQRQQADAAFQSALDEQKQAIDDEIQSQLLRISTGEKDFQQRTKLIQVSRDEAKALKDLAQQRDAGDIDQATYEKRAAQIRKLAEEAAQAWKKGFADIDALQANWVNGAIKAFTDYKDAANDVAGQTYGIFSDALHGLEDVFVDFFTKGKADWKGFFDGIAAEITRFVVRQQLSKLAQKFLPGLTGEQGDSSASALSGAAGQLAASAAPLYGAAAALSASAAALAAAGGAQGISGGATTGGSGSWLSSLFSLFSSGGGEQIYAKGGAFSHGAEIQAFAYGGVVGGPTYFPMAGGKMGLMGEEKPEAIMPLKRGPDGRLGVVAQVQSANDSHRSGPAVVNQNVYVQGRIDSRTASQFAQATAREQNRASSRNR